jgi:hypothetical protein
LICASETARKFFVARLSRQLQKFLLGAILLDKISVMARAAVHLP